jgi:hypothetical protein
MSVPASREHAMPCEEFDYLNLVNVREGDVMPNSFLAVPVGLTHKLFRFSGIICHNFVGQSGDWRRYTATVTLPNMGLNWVSASQVDPSQNRLEFEHGAATVFLARSRIMIIPSMPVGRWIV